MRRNPEPPHAKHLSPRWTIHPQPIRASDSLWSGSAGRFNRIAHTRETMDKDGINSLSYRLLKKEKLDLYTKITVDVGRP